MNLETIAQEFAREYVELVTLLDHAEELTSVDEYTLIFDRCQRYHADLTSICAQYPDIRCTHAPWEDQQLVTLNILSGYVRGKIAKYTAGGEATESAEQMIGFDPATISPEIQEAVRTKRNMHVLQSGKNTVVSFGGSRKVVRVIYLPNSETDVPAHHQELDCPEGGKGTSLAVGAHILRLSREDNATFAYRLIEEGAYELGRASHAGYLRERDLLEPRAVM